MINTSPATALKQGQPLDALNALQSELRARPSDVKTRIFLCQLLMVTGQWQRALEQLNVLSNLDASTLPMLQTYSGAIRSEISRGKVFDGELPPVVLGQPEPWLAWLIEAMILGARGEATHAERLRAQAFEEAPAIGGSLDGRPFKWIADADSRLGPVLEAVINGQYYWVPFERLSHIEFEVPRDLRDVVWMPAHLDFTNGGSAVALIPTRYSGSEESVDGQILLSRKTEWMELAPNLYCGHGQRVLATDHGETALMDVREIVLDSEPAPHAAHG